MSIDRTYTSLPQDYTICTSSTRPASPTEGHLIYETDTNIMLVYNSSAWVCLTPQGATVATSQGTASTSYTDLATAGPAVTVTTGTTALVTISATLTNSNGLLISLMSVAVSGATTLAAADANSIQVLGGSAPSGSRTFKLSSLTAGDNTFTAKYRTNGASTATFFNRDITVVGLP